MRINDLRVIEKFMNTLLESKQTRRDDDDVTGVSSKKSKNDDFTNWAQPGWSPPTPSYEYEVYITCNHWRFKIQSNNDTLMINDSEVVTSDDRRISYDYDLKNGFFRDVHFPWVTINQALVNHQGIFSAEDKIKWISTMKPADQAEYETYIQLPSLDQNMILVFYVILPGKPPYSDLIRVSIEMAYVPSKRLEFNTSSPNGIRTISWVLDSTKTRLNLARQGKMVECDISECSKCMLNGDKTPVYEHSDLLTAHIISILRIGGIFDQADLDAWQSAIERSWFKSWLIVGEDEEPPDEDAMNQNIKTLFRTIKLPAVNNNKLTLFAYQLGKVKVLLGPLKPWKLRGGDTSYNLELLKITIDLPSG